MNFLKNTDKTQIKNYIWNMISGLVNASEAIVIVSFVSWKFDMIYAGIMTIAFTLANIFMQIGGIGIRPYQVANYRIISFRSFFRFRAAVVGVMLAAVIVYDLFFLSVGTYTPQKCVIIALVCLWYVAEAFEEIFSSQLHAAGKLYIGKIMFTVRWLCIMTAFIVTSFVTDNIIAACAASLIVSITVLAIMMTVFDLRLLFVSDGKDNSIRDMAKLNFSVIILGILFMFLSLLPKYMTDFILDPESVAIYGYLFMPVFALDLISGFLYQPKLPEFSEKLISGQIGKIRQMIKSQILTIAALSIFASIGAYLLGVPVLSVIYHTDLSPYRAVLVIHMISGGLIAVGAFLSTILILDSRQTLSARIHAIFIPLSIITYYILIKIYGISGAAYAYFIFTSAYAAVLYVSVSVILKKKAAY